MDYKLIFVKAVKLIQVFTNHHGQGGILIKEINVQSWQPLKFFEGESVSECYVILKISNLTVDIWKSFVLKVLNWYFTDISRYLGAVFAFFW